MALSLIFCYQLEQIEFRKAWLFPLNGPLLRDLKFHAALACQGPHMIDTINQRSCY